MCVWSCWFGAAMCVTWLWETGGRREDDWSGGAGRCTHARSVGGGGRVVRTWATRSASAKKTSWYASYMSTSIRSTASVALEASSLSLTRGIVSRTKPGRCVKHKSEQRLNPRPL